MPGVPALLLARLDAIGACLAVRPDTLALLGLGSVGTDTARLDEHSDLDFFVVVEPGAKERYLGDLGWLTDACEIAFSFPNTADGRKVLFVDGVYAEYAVFEPAELAAVPAPSARVVWSRDDAAGPATAPGPVGTPPADVDFHVNEALTNVFVGLHRDARGEKLSGARLIQVNAVDRLLSVADLLAGPGSRQDPFAIERGAERRIDSSIDLARCVPGYAANPAAAEAILEWLETRTEPHPAMVAAIRALLVAGDVVGADPPR